MKRFNEEEKQILKEKLIALGKEALSWIKMGVIVVSVTYILAGVIFGVAVTVGWSMYPTIKNGDVLITRRVCYEPKRGDLVIANVDDLDLDVKYLTKRVIGLPGDTIYIDTDTATVYLNGDPLEEPYLGSPTTEDGSMLGRTVTVSEGHVFLMGDNRQHSTDSRIVVVGEIPIEDLQKIIFIAYHARGTPDYDK